MWQIRTQTPSSRIISGIGSGYPHASKYSRHIFVGGGDIATFSIPNMWRSTAQILRTAAFASQSGETIFTRCDRAMEPAIDCGSLGIEARGKAETPISSMFSITPESQLCACLYHFWQISCTFFFACLMQRTTNVARSAPFLALQFF